MSHLAPLLANGHELAVKAIPDLGLRSPFQRDTFVFDELAGTAPGPAGHPWAERSPVPVLEDVIEQSVECRSDMLTRDAFRLIPVSGSDRVRQRQMLV